MLQDLFPECRNLILLGEAGCGKSELAVNLSVQLASSGESVQLFDLDMTKPLFRLRDEKEQLEKLGIQFRYEEQFQDAPTVVGGVVRSLKDDSVFTILDVGGDHIGARAIGGYAPYLNRENTVALYIINPFRPWSRSVDWVSRVLGEILTVSRLRQNRVRFVGNPNMGTATTKEDVMQGWEALQTMVDREYITMLCIRQDLLATGEDIEIPVFPIKQYLSYPWEPGDAE